MKKILLDENLPDRIVDLFPIAEFNIHTIHSLQWEGKDDSEMLSAMKLQNFDGLLTADRNL